jgi:hypothetical protein
MKVGVTGARVLAVVGVLALGLVASTAGAYPLDGAELLGIRRLWGYQAKQARKWGSKLPPGALLRSDQIRLHLKEHPDLDVDGHPPDPALQGALEAMLSRRDPSYSVAVLDITDPAAPAWAVVRGDRTQVPGSVGKIGILIGFFDALARAFPDLEKRMDLLTTHGVKATDWAVGDRHTVPKWDPKANRNRHRVIQKGELYSLAEWVDHMVSVSANSAASTVWKEAMLLRRFGAEYPPTLQQEAEFFSKTSRKELQTRSLQVIEDPLRAAGIRAAQFRQGTMFTRHGKKVVPGVRSFASPVGLVRILVRLEQGRLVDEWSSQLMKRFLYFTKRRVRYAFAPELKHAAVYFKSGSMYGCKPEPGYNCTKFKGNRMNIMNSVAIVESPAGAGEDPRVYLVALISNRLKVNAAWEHSRIAAAIEQAIRKRAPVVIQDQGDAAAQDAAGRGAEDE